MFLAATIISFPQPRKTYSAIASLPAQTLRPRGLHLITPDAKTSATSVSTQEQANRIVTQIEREIACQAYARNQRSLGFSTPTALPCPVHEIETPASVARRIFDALKSFARSA
jgi:hypothetical protein